MGCGSSLVGGATGALGSLTGISSFGKGAKQAAGQTATGVGESKAYTERALGGLDPYAQVGTEALDLYKDAVLGGDQEAFRTTPGYDFRLGQGAETLEQGAAARGGLLSGAQQRALTEYGQDYGSEEYNNYLAQLGRLSGQGMQAAGQQGSFLTGTGSNILGAQSSLGQTQAQMQAMKGQATGGLFSDAMSAAGSLIGGSMKKPTPKAL